MYSRILIVALVALSLLTIPVMLSAEYDRHMSDQSELPGLDRPAPLGRRDFRYIFNTTERLQETDTPQDSSSPYWWLDSGGEMLMGSGVGATLQGVSEAESPWRLAYALSNPTDTDGGAHPQNLFRLLTKDHWHNFRQEVYVQIARSNDSASPNHNASNGVFLFNRYQDQNNLYYAGMRVDGAVVIKKKLAGQYYQLAYAPYFIPAADQASFDNLLPQGKWIGIRTEVQTISGNRVKIALSLDVNGNNQWQQVLVAIDDGRLGAPILKQGSGGIRTDFMDVLFREYRMQDL